MNKSILKFQMEHMDGFKGEAITFGNSKLDKSIMIYNLTSAHNCASCRLGLCEVADKCYAQKGERQYPDYLNKNLVMEKFNEGATAEEVYELIELYWKTKREKPKTLRLDEAGEFPDQLSVDKMDKVAKMCQETLGLKVYTYTARADLDFTGVKHFQINASRDDIKGATRRFKVLSHEEFDNLPKGTLKCNGMHPGCGTCKICYDDRTIGMTVYVRSH